MILSTSSQLLMHRHGKSQLSDISDQLPGVCEPVQNSVKLAQSPQAAELKARNQSEKPSRLLTWSELPGWQKEDSSYVETGYRVATPSVWECFASWGYLHNETVNIFTHLIGAVLFLNLPSILYHELRHRYETAGLGDVVVFAIYLFGVSVCFTLSFVFHTVASHSPEGFAFGIQLDFQGIIVLIWSATVPLVYYSFHHEPTLQWMYWSLTTAFAVSASIITFTPAFHRPATKPLRAGVFGLLALSTLVCVSHGLVYHGWQQQSERFSMSIISLTLLLNSAAAAVYVARFPERWWRRTFDLFGASHQLMHCLIVAASLTWVMGIARAFDNAHSVGHLSV